MTRQLGMAHPGEVRESVNEQSAEALTGFRWLVVAFGRHDVLTKTENSPREAYYNFKRNGHLFIFDGGWGLNGRYKPDQPVLEMRVDSRTANAVGWSHGPNLAREQHEAIRDLCPPDSPKVFTTIRLSWSGLTVTMSAHDVDIVLRRAGHLPLP